jgi:hypothetical protein
MWIKHASVRFDRRLGGTRFADHDGAVIATVTPSGTSASAAMSSA